MKKTAGHTALYFICSIFFILSLAGIAALLATDIQHGLKFTTLHQHLDAWPLSMIGLSYIALQFAMVHSTVDKIKGIFLGVAFLCWGAEQLLPQSRLVTLLDEGAVTIFVVDISIIVWGQLNKTVAARLP